MNRILIFALVLAILPTSASAQWAGRVDNFYDKLLDSTFINPPDTATPVFSTATKKWSAIAGGGGGGSDASTVTKGITKLSFPPASASNPIALGSNDPTVNPTPSAANAGNIPVVQTGGNAYGHIDPPAGTDTFLASLGTAVPGAFRAIIATDIDELLASSDLTDFSSAKSGTGASVVSNVGSTIQDFTLSTFVSFADQSANAGTTGRLQRNGDELSWKPTGTATNLEQVGRKNAANGYAGLNGSSKLTASQGQELWNLVDLLDVTFTGLANNDILMRIGGAWVNAVSAGDVTWTGSGNTITTTIAANAVTFGKMQTVAANVVLGNDASGTAVEALTLGGTASALAASASNGSASSLARSDHAHKGIVAQSAGSNLDGGNGNATLNVSGTFSTTTASSGTITVIVEPPTGSVMIWPTATPPVGWVLLRGGAISRTGAGAALFAVIGTTYGAGDGSTTFNVPDCGGRVVAGSEAVATRLTNGVSGITGSTLGSAGGDQNRPQHNHGITDPGHTHSASKPDPISSGSSPNSINAGSLVATQSATTGITINNDGTGTAGNVQPTIVMNYIMKL